LEPLGLSVSEGAKILGVTRQALNNVVNGKSGISVDMAIRLTKAFGSDADTWIRLQGAYDLAQAMKNESKVKVQRQRVPAELRVDSDALRWPCDGPAMMDGCSPIWCRSGVSAKRSATRICSSANI
jgi:addiction module HigA family antidote